MNWDAIGAIAEIAGAMAVLLTLIFIAKQISIHSRELERANQFHNAQSTMSNNALYVQIWQPIMQDADLAEIYLKAPKNEPLSRVDSLRFEIYANTFLALTEAAFYQTASDVGFDDVSTQDITVIEILGPYLHKLLTNDVGEKWFLEEAPALFTGDFLQAVQQQIQRT